MKKILFVISMFVFSIACISDTVVDVYSIKLRLKVPRVYDNTMSTGYRKYVTQKLSGKLYVTYTDGYFSGFEVIDLVNRSHRVNGVYVTYECRIGEQIYPRLGYVGNNRTGKFKKTYAVLFIEAEPSYSMGSGEDEDNSLYVLLSGIGNSKKKDGVVIPYHIIGKVAGHIGCGCKGYGHVSPTRKAGACGPSDFVDDVAAVKGYWTMKLISAGCCRSCIFTK